MKYTTPYVAPTLVVDAVIFQLVEGKLSVLLMQRPNEPFKGAWALPGGYNPQGETTSVALERIVEQKTGISIIKDLSYIEQLYTFDTVARDPRGHAEVPHDDAPPAQPRGVVAFAGAARDSAEKRLRGALAGSRMCEP